MPHLRALPFFLVLVSFFVVSFWSFCIFFLVYYGKVHLFTLLSSFPLEFLYSFFLLSDRSFDFSSSFYRSSSLAQSFPVQLCFSSFLGILWTSFFFVSRYSSSLSPSIIMVCHVFIFATGSFIARFVHSHREFAFLFTFSLTFHFILLVSAQLSPASFSFSFCRPIQFSLFSGRSSIFWCFRFCISYSLQHRSLFSFISNVPFFNASSLSFLFSFLSLPRLVLLCYIFSSLFLADTSPFLLLSSSLSFSDFLFLFLFL